MALLLEVEFYRQLNHASSYFVRYIAERVGIAHFAIGPKLKVQVVIVPKAPQRMVESVVAREPELQLTCFGKFEILEYRQIGVHKPRAEHFWHHIAAIVARRWQAEARGVDVLMVL